MLYSLAKFALQVFATEHRWDV